MKCIIIIQPTSRHQMDLHMPTHWIKTTFVTLPTVSAFGIFHNIHFIFKACYVR